MFGTAFGSARAKFLTGAVTSVLALTTMSGAAMAADRGHSGGEGWHGGGGGWHGGGGFRTSLGISLNLGDLFWGPRYCAPSAYYCPAPVYYRSYYSPAVVYQPYYQPVVYTSPSVVYSSPDAAAPQQVVVQQQPNSVQQQPAYQQPVYQQPTYQQPAVQQQQPVQQQAPVSQQPVAGRYQDRELGDAYMRVADFNNASRVYNRYLSAWNGDGAVTRNLGFSLVGTGNVQDGFRAVAQGYRLEPNLFDRPARASDLGGTYGFQNLLDAATRGATGANTPEGWFTLAVLNQAGGNNDAAINALQHARDAGLDTNLLDQATLRITPPKK